MAGSQKSLLALALEMRKLGHKILFVGGAGKFESELKKFSIDYRTRLDSRFTPLSIIGLIKLLSITRKSKPDIIHCSSYWPHIESLFIGSILNIPVITTFPGGPFYPEPIIPKHPIISYSEELRHAILKHYSFPEHCIITLKNRLDLTDILDINIFEKKANFKRNSFIFIGRLSDDKESSILSFLNFIKQIYKSNFPVKGNILGGGNLHYMIEKKATFFNRKVGKSVFELFGPTLDVIPFILNNDIAVGHGRSVLEAMALGRPGIVPCMDGVLSLVTEKNATKHAYFNFAGRFTHKKEEIDENNRNIYRLLNNKEYFLQISDFSSKYVVFNYDVSQIKTFMNKLYFSEVQNYSQSNNIRERFFVFCLCTYKYIGRSLRKIQNIKRRFFIWYRSKFAFSFKS